MAEKTEKKPVKKPRQTKTPAAKTTAVQEPRQTKKIISELKYVRSLGRRKRATAIAKLSASQKGIKINGKDLNGYFTLLEMQKSVQEPLRVADLIGKVGVEITARGGGVRGQAEAARLAVARAIIKENPDLKRTLKVRGLLTRDSRQKERKKFGLKKARKAFQWSKR